MRSLHAFLNQSRAHLYITILFCVLISLMLAGFAPEQGMREMRLSFHEALQMTDEARPDMLPSMRPTSATPWHTLQKIKPEVQGLSESTAEMTSFLATLERNALKTMHASSTVLPFLNTNVPCDTPDGLSPQLAFASLSIEKQCAPSLQTTKRIGELVAKNQAKNTLFGKRANKYKQWVSKYTKQYKINPNLIYAIIQAESSFKPNLISSRNAHGLMQVVPSSAGAEVHKWLGLAGQPSSYVLLNPSTNIKYGTTYVYLLLTRHLGDIDDVLTREYCTIAAYNMGINAMLRTFAPTKEEAVALINKMTPNQAYAYLQANMPAKETRNYLKKVVANMARFSGTGLVAAK